ncbi:hypothetical protein Dhaf_1416 [Desulfitobacterium hafniense DCB-2]|uniref:Uncharacterized protein n=2 Tax=root TaxID=1 RepID=B8FNU7_DESHD|nr:hypothetical protein [Desulfitobacterium hafniense]ACL19472.1 hypothetical protein Dhaf_1416 [Desulfitobacterium hafniense DCB-2]MEA5023574.1 hypothetical protein [Desulfitobacterium hafniense]
MATIDSALKMFGKMSDVADRLIEAAKVIGEPTIGAAMEQQQIMDTFSVKTGSEPLGAVIYDRITKQALGWGEDVNASLSGAMSFMSTTMDPDKLTQLNALAARLSKLNPAEGLEGAALSMKELMSGDYTSIAEGFNMSGTMLQGSAAYQAGLQGDVDGFIKGMDELLNQQNMTEAAFEKMLDRPAAKWQRIIQTFNFSLAKAGEEAAKALSPLFDMIIKGFESEGAKVFLNILSIGLTSVVTGIQWMLTMLQDGWPAIQQILLGIGTLIYNLGVILLGLIPIIMGVVAAWVAYNAVGLIANGITFITGTLIPIVRGLMAKWNIVTLMLASGISLLALKQRLLHYVMNINPIGLVIGLVIGLITVLGALSVVTNGVKKVFSDAFGFIVDVAEGAINAVLRILNGAIRGINEVSGFFANLLGIEAKQIKEIQFKADFSEFKKAGQEAIENFSMDALKEKLGFDNKFQMQEDYGWDGSIPNIDDALSSIDHVGEVGKIGDTVDISSEDLKIMRELAEMKNIQNFVTLTPTVSVTTGDIRNGSDADTIVAKIKMMLEKDIASSASAVYG